MRHFIAFALLTALVAGTSGCFNPFDPRISTERIASTPAPVPSSPSNAVLLFEWCWKNRGLKEYEELFTDDYRFQFAEADSAGNLYRDVPYTREDEMKSAEGIFVGTADHPPASDIQLDFDNTLIPLNDDRPGKNPTWHKSIRTRVDLKVTLDRGNGPEVNEVHGYAKFYVVRGDSAAIPPELASRFKPDPNRWWIERWEDETLPSGATAAASPAGPGSARAAAPASATILFRDVTFGEVKNRGR